MQRSLSPLTGPASRSQVPGDLLGTVGCVWLHCCTLKLAFSISISLSALGALSTTRYVSVVINSLERLDLTLSCAFGPGPAHDKSPI